MRALPVILLFLFLLFSLHAGFSTYVACSNCDDEDCSIEPDAGDQCCPSDIFDACLDSDGDGSSDSCKRIVWGTLFLDEYYIDCSTASTDSIECDSENVDTASDFLYDPDKDGSGEYYYCTNYNQQDVYVWKTCYQLDDGTLSPDPNWYSVQLA